MVTPVLGLMAAVTVGAVFSTLIWSLSLALPPSASVAVTVHRTMSVGETVDGLRVRLSLVLVKVVDALSLVHA